MEKIAKNVTSNTEMVTISRAEYCAIQQELSAKAQELAAALLQNDWLMEQLNLAKKKLFGQSSEKAGEAVMEQLSLVTNEAEAIDAGSYVQETSKSKVTAHIRKRRSGSIEDVIPEGLPVEVVEHRLSEEERHCPDCDAEMVEIGKEIHRSLRSFHHSTACWRMCITRMPVRPASRKPAKRSS